MGPVKWVLLYLLLSSSYIFSASVVAGALKHSESEQPVSRKYLSMLWKACVPRDSADMHADRGGPNEGKDQRP